MVNNYYTCKICKKIIETHDSDSKINHLDKYHTKEYKEYAEQERNFNIEYEKLKELYPLAMEGMRTYFDYFRDKETLSNKQKKEIRIFSKVEQ